MQLRSPLAGLGPATPASTAVAAASAAYGARALETSRGKLMARETLSMVRWPLIGNDDR